MGYVDRLSPAENLQLNATRADPYPSINFDLARERRDGAGSAVLKQENASRDQVVATGYRLPNMVVDKTNDRPSQRPGEFAVAAASSEDTLTSIFQPQLEKGPPRETRVGRTTITPLRDQSTEGEGQLYGLRDMDNRSGPHKDFDSLVYVPNGFDPKKPANLVVHAHGWYKDTREAWNYYELGKQLRGADPQTIVVMPAWQDHDGAGGVPRTKRDAGSSNQGDLDQPGAYSRMLQETFNKTPGLQGLKLGDLKQITVIAHSAGYVPTGNLINELGPKITTLAMLDSPRSGDVDAWLAQNKEALRKGDKQYLAIYHSYRDGGRDQLQAVWGASTRKAEQPANGFMAIGPSQHDLPNSDLKGRSVVYIDSPSSHYEIPQRYFGTVIGLSNELRRER